jgi:DNA-binding NarL/FixJ family response regulator
MQQGVRIVVADDHPLFREALQQAVGDVFGSVSFVEADSFDTLRTAAEANEDADLVLLDLDMPGAHGFSALAWLRSQFPALPVVIISATTDPRVMRRSVDFGSSGFIPKSSSLKTIATAIQSVLDGEVWLPEAALTTEDEALREDQELAQKIATLTPQQFRVLMMLADGLLNKQIAAELQVSEATIKAHVTAILRKMGLRSRTQAAVAARRLERAADIEPQS